MHTIQGDRQQFTLLPASIEDYVSAQDRVRLYDAFVEHLVRNKEVQFPAPNYEGQAQYDRPSLLKLLL